MKSQSLARVKKFGGTSVGSIERIEAVAERIAEDLQNGERPVIVVSAMAGETNRLVALGRQIDPKCRGPAYDMLLASGEQVSVALLSLALAKRGVRAKPFLGFQLGIQTDELYSKARILNIETAKLRELVTDGVVPVIAGFQGVDKHSNITTLGRGGSDTSAVAVAAALGAEACEIYTDVPAVFSADPRLVSRAREVDRISFEEMMEMASLGSKVLHIRSVEIAAKYQVKLHVRSTFEKREGTWIVPEGEVMESPAVTAVTHDENIVVFKLFPVQRGSQFLAKLFDTLSKRGVVVDIITQSENEEGQRLAFSVSGEDLHTTEDILSSLKSEGGFETTPMENMAKVSVVGVGMRNHPGVASKFFSVLAEENLTIHLVTTSEIKISAVIERGQLSKAAQALHTAFDLDRDEA